MNRTSMLLSRSGPPDRTPWKTRSSGPSDFTTLYLRIALPALTSTVSSLSRWIRSRTQLGRKPVVFQIAYDGGRATARTSVLRLQGYEVVSVIGNEAAKVVLSMPEQYDFFIVGHAADDQVREEMVLWLKAHYPGVRILALNPPKVSELAGADYNVKLNGPETWLPIIATALRGPQESGPSSIR